MRMRPTTSSLLVLALLAGCGRSALLDPLRGQATDDGGTPDDLAPALDLTGMDLTSMDDLVATTGDMTGSPDLVQIGGDDLGPLDFSVPNVDIAVPADIAVPIDIAVPPLDGPPRDIAVVADLAVVPPDFFGMDLSGVDLQQPPVPDLSITDGPPADQTPLADLASTDMAKSVCGDKVVTGNEECDDGPNNADSPAFVVSQPGTNITFSATPVDSLKTAVQFYNLTNNQANTGFEKAQRSELFLYRNAADDTFSLFTVTGAAGGGGFGFATMNISNLPQATTVVVADKRANQFQKAGPTNVNALWFWFGGTVGGVLSQFPVPSPWDVTVTPAFTFGVNTWVWVDRGGVVTALNRGTTLHVTAFSKAAACRKNCTVPRCGDGILDAGELCDHGAQNGIDGLCGKNCK